MKDDPRPAAAIHADAEALRAMLRQALMLHQRGQLVQAKRLYEDILAIQPRHFDCLHMLGVIASQTDDPLRAAELIGKAIGLQPGNADAYFNRGLALQALGQWDAAVASYDRAIALNPNYAEAYSNRGNALQSSKQWQAAVASYEQAIALNPKFAEAHFNRGIALKELGQVEAALAAYESAIACRRNYAEAYCNRGLVLQAMKQLDAAIASYDSALAVKPDYADAYCNRGTALQALGQWEAAVADYDKAVALKPDFAPAYYNRGVALKELMRWDAALASYDQAVSIDAAYADAYLARGLALQALKRTAEAIASYDQALAARPAFAEAYFNRGNAQQECGQWDAADAGYGQAIALKPDYADAYWNKALLKLVTGDYAEGWRLYEWRWKSEQKEFARHFSAPLWLGDASLQGKTILLYCEQGLGDTLQFCRYIEQVAALGARVMVEAPPALIGLIKTLGGVSAAVTSMEQAPAYDHQCPLMSLPLAFKTTLDTIPARVPYLKTDPGRVAYWKAKLHAGKGMRIGIVWAGGFRPNQARHLLSLNERRNLPLSQFAALNMPGLSFYSLQVGEEAQAQWRELEAAGWNGPRIEDYTDELRDFSDTAALIENLDLVISVDTAVAHLAGALGKPVWLLNRHDTCWRWLLEREDTPWYPSMRIFRQAAPGDWEGVMVRVQSELRKLLSCAPAPDCGSSPS